MIIISTPESSNGGSADFDCGLAMENMYVAAQALGLGSHIYMTGVNVVNGKKDVYGIPEGYKVNSILRIGNVPQTPDANSSASARKNFEEVVNYK
jgi:nitroreductase